MALEPIDADNDLFDLNYTLVDDMKDISPDVVEPEFDDLDKRLVQAMADLSVEEIQDSLLDVYGAAKPAVETPSLITDRLSEFDGAIAKLVKKQKQKKNSYEMANQQSPAYVEKFRLMALRATSFDAKAAAQRLITFFEKKVELFGADLITKDIQIGDLNEAAVAVLESGFVQLLQERDQAGRAIICFFPVLLPLHLDVLSMRRVTWYMFMTALEDEETQKMGTVVIVNNFGPRRRSFPPHAVKNIAATRFALLDRSVGVHICYDNFILRPLFALVMTLANKNYAARNRFHYGKLNDYKAVLLPYGIRTELLPIDGMDCFPLDAHTDWLKRRRLEELTNSSVEDIVVPRRFDVLFGRGKGFAFHSGNIRVRRIVELHGDVYENANKNRKTEIAERIVGVIHESNGRFLKQGKCGWEEVHGDIARDKISHLFRKLRMNKPKQRKIATKATN